VFDVLKDYLGEGLLIEEYKQKLALPIFMTCRRIYKITTPYVSFGLVEVLSEDNIHVTTLKKQLYQYADSMDMNVAYCIEVTTRQQRNSLISHSIPFISIPGQVYLPFLGIILRDDFRKKSLEKREKMMPATQMVFLYLLYSDRNKPFLKSDIAEHINVTRTTITRATAQLREMGLIEEEKKGKEIYVFRNMETEDFFERAKPYLINPIQRSIFIREDKKSIFFPDAGESALSKRTILNPPEIMEKAISHESTLLDSVEEIDVRWENRRDYVKLQLWKYNPELFSKDNVVDPISLICSFDEVKDERIELCIEELMERGKWYKE
jgi:DNA-binding MarR family transcriptional regulator